VRLQEKPKGRPGTCAVIPGRATDPEGFVATGHIVPGWDPEMTFSAAGIKQLANVIGLPSKEAHQALKEERDVLQARVEQLEAENEELSRFADAIDTIESRDFRARKRPGRKPKQQESANV
jgi:hypothetical protein